MDRRKSIIMGIECFRKEMFNAHSLEPIIY